MSTRMRIKKVALFCVISAGFLMLSVFSAAEEKSDGKKEVTLKTQATCPIMSGPINKELYVDANGKRIYVCCKGCLDVVKKDPAAALKKLAKLGEKAADIPILQKTCPVMGGPINKSLYVEHEGKKLYVCCQGCLETVKKEPAKYAKKIAEQIEKDKAKEKATSKVEKPKAPKAKEHDHHGH